MIRTTPELELGYRAVFTVCEINNSKYDNFYFEDIQITDNVSIVFGFRLYSPKGLTPAGQFSNFYFKNVRITGTETTNWYREPNNPVPVTTGTAAYSYFYVPNDGSFVKQFTFEDFYIGGSCMRSLS